MHDAIRRIGTLLVVALLAATTFYVFQAGREGYGLLDFIRGEKAPRGGKGVDYTLPDRPPIDLNEVAVLERLSQEYASLMEVVRPSVVSISTQKRVLYLRSVLGIFNIPEEGIEPGLGSGVIVTDKGYILTNEHVITGVDSIVVTLSDGSTYEAELVATATGIDLAVLKIVGGGGRTFSPLPFGKSSEVRVGEVVFAIGNPFGLGESVTQGIISALPRRLKDDQVEMFQTDTAINQGNSGGPLVNVRGELIGINRAIYTGDDGIRTWRGVSLAIPSDDAKASFESIMRTGESVLGYLGVEVPEPRDGRYQRGVLPDGSGIQIAGVTPGSPAEEAGLLPGDIIFEFEGKPIVNNRTLLSLINSHPVGKPARIKLVRGGTALDVEATIRDRSELVRTDLKKADMKISDALGISVRNLSLFQRHRMGMGQNVPGIEVRDVARDSPLFGRLQTADIITKINGAPVYSTVQFFEHVDQLRFDEKSYIFFVRDGREQPPVVVTPRTTVDN